MKALIRRYMTQLPVLRIFYYWTRRHYHSLRTLAAAKKYFVDFGAYRQALYKEEEGTVDIRTVDGLTITIRKNGWDARILQEIFLEKPYLQNITLGDHGIIVDIGSYIGDFSLYAAKYLQARQVIAYEPSLKNFKLLQHNVKNNHYEDRIVAVNMAVSDSNEVMMDVDAPDRNQANVSTYYNQNGTLQRIPSVTLVGLMDAHELASIDLLKMDCEGGEYPILLSAPVEALQRIQNIVFEYHEIEGFEGKLREVHRKLSDAGFKLQTQAGAIVCASRS